MRIVPIEVDKITMDNADQNSLLGSWAYVSGSTSCTGQYANHLGGIT